MGYDLVFIVTEELCSPGGISGAVMPDQREICVGACRSAQSTENRRASTAPTAFGPWSTLCPPLLHSLCSRAPAS